jgi:pimeloyl-ACP methyl ester carboxylesterase
LKKTLKYTFIGVLALYLTICLGLYFKQEAIIFPGRIENEKTYQYLKNKLPNAEWQFTTKNNVLLKGWFNELDESKPLYIYYGGNAEDVTSTFEIVQQTVNRSLLAVNFRGFGKSGGEPTEKDLFSDALEIFDSLQTKYKDRAICLIGRSLGSGVACFVASSRKIKSLSLITPYDSISAIAQKKYSLIPIGLLLKHPFNSIQYSEKITVPTLFLLANYDFIIPRDHSMNLYDHWKAPKTFFIVPDSGHNNMLAEYTGMEKTPKLFQYFQDFMLKAEEGK